MLIMLRLDVGDDQPCQTQVTPGGRSARMETQRPVDRPAPITARHDQTDRICAVRDSKTPGTVLAFGRGEWERFTAAVKAGTFGLS
jgi:hypothetical protein